jgi:hypothetical protein
MTWEFWLPYATAFSVIASGIFALIKWADQRNRELVERRFEQYWKLVDVSNESQYLAKQKVALLLLKRFPEYKAETVAFLRDSQKLGGPWLQQNVSQVDDVLDYFTKDQRARSNGGTNRSPD